MAELQITYPDGQVRFRAIDSKEKIIHIGGGGKCNLRLEGSGVKLSHCFIKIARDRVLVEPGDDVSSVIVNNKKSTGQTLKDRDSIAVGQYVVSYFEKSTREKSSSKALRGVGAEEYYTPFWKSRIFIGVTAAILTLGGSGLYFFLSHRDTAAKALYNKGLDSMENAKAHGEASSAFDEFLKEHKDHPLADQVKVLKQEAKVRVHSEAPAPDWKLAVQEAETLCKNFNKAKFFKDNGKKYSKLIGEIGLGAAKDSGDRAEPSLLDTSASAIRLLDEYFRPEDRNPETIAGIRTLETKAKSSIDEDKKRKESVQKISDAVGRKDPMAVYREHRALYVVYPKYRKDAAILRERGKAGALERELVKFEAISIPGKESATPPSPDGVVTVQRRAEAGLRPTGARFVTLVADSVYCLDAGDGSVLWRRPTGYEPSFQPLILDTSKGRRSGVLYHDVFRRELALVEAATGKDIWRRTTDAVKPRWSSMPTAADGQIFVVSDAPEGKSRLLVFSAETGAVTGQFVFPQPVTGSPMYDAKRKRILLLGEQVSLYVLDLTSNSCELAIPIDHDAESVRAEPIFQGRFLFLAETIGPEKSRIRCFVLSDQEAKATEKQSIELPGKIWRTPMLADGRLYVTTDMGDFHIFEVADENDEKSLAPLARSGDGVRRSGESQAYPYSPSIDQLWIIGDRLTAIDPKLGPVVSTTLFERPLGGFPSVAPIGVGDSVIMVTRNQVGPGTVVSAVAAKGAKEKWRVELGRSPEMVVADGTGLAVTIDGKRNAYSLDDVSKGKVGVVDLPVETGSKPQGQAETSAPMTIREWSSGVLQWFGPGSKRLVYFNKGGERKEIVLPSGAKISGRPTPFGKSILVPSDDGKTYAVDPETAAQTADPYIHPQLDGRAVPLGPVAMLDEKSAVIFADKQFVKVNLNSSSKLPYFESARKVDLDAKADYVLLNGGVLFIAVGREIRAFDPVEFKPIQKWALTGAVRRDPVVVGSAAVFVTDHQEAVCIEAEGGKADKKWTAKIVGSPVGVAKGKDDVLWFAMSDGKINGLKLADGAPIVGGDLSRALIDGPIPVAGRLAVLTPDGGVLLAPEK